VFGVTAPTDWQAVACPRTRPPDSDAVAGRAYGAGMGTEPSWEPPRAGTEVEALLGALDRLRVTFRWKTDALDSTGLNATIPSSTLTLGGLLKHLAAMEDYYSTVKLTGEPLGEPWTAWGWDGSNDWEIESAADDTPEHLYGLYDGAVRRHRDRLAATLADGGLDGRVAAGGGQLNVRRLVLDLVEEYGRHTGHADLLREAVDGRTGEDPDPEWVPPF
jgi:hypothetical protein